MVPRLDRIDRRGDVVGINPRHLPACRCRAPIPFALRRARRVLSEHTNAHRAAQLEALLEGCHSASLAGIAA